MPLPPTGRADATFAKSGGRMELIYLPGNITSAGDTTVVASAGTGMYNRLVSLLIVNNDDYIVDVSVQETGSATNLVPRITLPPYGGQLQIYFDGFGYKQPTAATGLDINVSNAGATPDVSWFIQHYTE